NKMGEYFTVLHDFKSIDELKSVSSLFDQVIILSAIDLHCNHVMFKRHSGYIAKDTRFSTYGDNPFFSNGSIIFNVSRYIEGGHENTRLMNILRAALQNDNTLHKIISDIRAVPDAN
ncbi:MAG: hypothetical protein ABI378_13995, partial [Chitinophagaceae bacterium]